MGLNSGGEGECIFKKALCDAPDKQELPGQDSYKENKTNGLVFKRKIGAEEFEQKLLERGKGLPNDWSEDAVPYVSPRRKKIASKPTGENHAPFNWRKTSDTAMMSAYKSRREYTVM